MTIEGQLDDLRVAVGRVEAALVADPEPARLVLTKNEVASMLGCSAATVTALVEAGCLAMIPLAGTSRMVIPRLSVERWIVAELDRAAASVG